MDKLAASAEAAAPEREARAIGVEAYVYVYPLVLMELTRRQVTNLPPGTRPGFAPMGAFAHIREFPAAEFRNVCARTSTPCTRPRGWT